MEYSKTKESKVRTSGGPSETDMLRGAKQFILTILKTTQPSRPVLIRPQSPLEPEEDGDDGYAVVNDEIVRQSLTPASSREEPEAREASAREAVGEAQAMEKPRGDLWDMLSKDLKADREIALAAFVGEHARLEDLPAPWNQDRCFFLEALEKNFRLWFRIPQPLVTDSNFTKFLSLRTDDMVVVAFETNPQLRENRQIWDQIISRFVHRRNDVLGNVMDDFQNGTGEGGSCHYCSLVHAPRSIRADTELMIKACSMKVAELTNVDESLLTDRDFLNE